MTFFNMGERGKIFAFLGGGGFVVEVISIGIDTRIRDGWMDGWMWAEGILQTTRQANHGETFLVYFCTFWSISFALGKLFLNGCLFFLSVIGMKIIMCGSRRNKKNGLLCNKDYLDQRKCVWTLFRFSDAAMHVYALLSPNLSVFR